MKTATVLVVDDEPMVRDVLCEILQDEDYAVAAVGTAGAALGVAKERSFDLLLADIKIPDMNGVELVNKFRELYPQIVPVLITGYPSTETVAAAMKSDIGDYVIKPVGKKELCSVIANALQKRRLADEEVKASRILSTKSGKVTHVVCDFLAKVIPGCIGGGLFAALLLTLGNLAVVNTPMLMPVVILSAGVSVAVAVGLQMTAGRKLQKMARATVICPKCGIENPVEARFCTKCGGLVP